MAENKVNLDTLISYYIHRPLIQGKGYENLPPLYGRIGAESESSFDKDGIQNPIWQERSKHTYNSPTNIRRIFIGDEKVYVQYYQPYIKDDKSSGVYWSIHSYKNNEAIGELARQILNGDFQNEEGKIVRTNFSRTGLGALSTHWKVSNIEEIYFTPNLLLSLDIRNWFGQAAALYNKAMSISGKLVENPIPLAIFEKVNGDNIKNIRTRFPRLRTVAVASNIDAMMSTPGARNFNEGMPSKISDLGMKWYSMAKSLGFISLGSIWVSQVPFENKGPCIDFSLRDGIYRFDAEVLSQYIAKYKRKVLELGMAQRDAKLGIDNTAKTPANTKSDLELHLEELEKQYGANAVQEAIRLGFAQASDDEIDAEFKKMSTEGNNRYRTMLGR